MSRRNRPFHQHTPGAPVPALETPRLLEGDPADVIVHDQAAYLLGIVSQRQEREHAAVGRVDGAHLLGMARHLPQVGRVVVQRRAHSGQGMARITRLVSGSRAEMACSLPSDYQRRWPSHARPRGCGPGAGNERRTWSIDQTSSAELGSRPESLGSRRQLVRKPLWDPFLAWQDASPAGGKRHGHLLRHLRPYVPVRSWIMDVAGYGKTRGMHEPRPH